MRGGAPFHFSRLWRTARSVRPESDADIYDNAIALLAFLANGTADSLRRARLIGDAFAYASRTYNDDRSCSDTIDPLGFDGAPLRTGYAAGDIALLPGWNPNGRAGTVPFPGSMSSRSTPSTSGRMTW